MAETEPASGNTRRRRHGRDRRQHAPGVALRKPRRALHEWTPLRLRYRGNTLPVTHRAGDGSHRWPCRRVSVGLPVYPAGYGTPAAKPESRGPRGKPGRRAAKLGDYHCVDRAVPAAVRGSRGGCVSRDQRPSTQLPPHACSHKQRQDGRFLHAGET